MDDSNWVVLSEPEGKIYVVELSEGVTKIKGIGVIDTKATLGELSIGDSVQLGNKSFTRVAPRLQELNRGMKRRAQTISAKDAGLFIAKLGIGPGDRVSMHIARSLGDSGILVTVEPRTEHADVGLENLRRVKEMWPQFPTHHHVEGFIEEVVDDIKHHSESFDAIILDLPQHVPAIEAVAPLLSLGGRIACYCPVTSQVEAAWKACENAGLEVEWAGELMERKWGMASKGGMRPVNGAFGHTAFLLFAYRKQ